MRNTVDSYQPLRNKKKFLALGIMVGCLVVFISVAAVFQRSFSEFEQRATNTVSYVGRQSLICDLYNYANTGKSSLRAFDSASSLARDIQGDISLLDDERLVQPVHDLRLTGAVVLDAEGNIVSSVYQEGSLPEKVLERLRSNSVLNVASYSCEEYFSRETLEDGSVVDVGAACRLDAPGVVVALYHTSSEYVNKYVLSIQTVLDGYNLSDNGTVVVENEGRIIASNNQEVIGHTVDGTIADDEVVEALKQQGSEGELTLVSCSSGLYLGTISKARDNYLYEYVPITYMVSNMIGAAIITLVVYIAVVMIVVGTRYESERKYLNKQMDAEKRYSKKLAESAKQADEANMAKTVFLQRMSHDVRTPLNGIVGMIEVADRCPDDLEKQTECRNKIREASKLLLGLVNEILDMSKLDSGDIVLDNQPLNLCAVLDSTFSVIEQQASLQGIEFIHEPYQMEHCCVLGSETHIKRLVMNILSNAVKYNKPGGTVTTSCKETSFDGQTVAFRFTCTDTGIGMSEEFQKHMFEPFTRECSSRSSEVNGTGLGMSIAQRLSKVMGGDITFESKEGIGTTFYVDFAFPVCGVADAAAGDKDLKPLSIEGVKVLLVEDNALNREIALFLLQEAGAEVVTANNGREALQVFYDSLPGYFDVIVMDVLMPEMDGYATTRKVRSSDRSDAQVPIIAMTANTFTEDKVAAREAGMNAHLAKPIDATRMVTVISECVHEQ